MLTTADMYEIADGGNQIMSSRLQFQALGRKYDGSEGSPAESKVLLKIPQSLKLEFFLPFLSSTSGKM